MKGLELAMTGLGRFDERTEPIRRKDWDDSMKGLDLFDERAGPIDERNGPIRRKDWTCSTNGSTDERTFFDEWTYRRMDLSTNGPIGNWTFPVNGFADQWTYRRTDLYRRTGLPTYGWT
ncbi:unnamed protein product [Laminaria digitata]